MLYSYTYRTKISTKRFFSGDENDVIYIIKKICETTFMLVNEFLELASSRFTRETF